MDKKIKKVTDYWNLTNINHLRKCNIEYGKAKRLLKKKKYHDARKAYESYIENMNSADIDAYYDLAKCYFQLAKLETNDEIKKKYANEGVQSLKKITRKEDDRKYISDRLLQFLEIYTRRALDKKIEKRFDWKKKDGLSHDELDEVIKIYEEESK